MRELLARLMTRPAIFAELIAASLLANVLALATPLFVIQVLNRYVAHGVDATLATLAVGTVIAIALEFGFRQVRLRLAAGVNARFDAELSNSVFRVLTGAKAQALGMLPPGARQQIVTSADTLQAAYAAPNVAALLDVPFALVFIGALFLLNATIGMIALAFVAAAFAVAWAVAASLRRPTRDAITAGGRRGALIQSADHAADTVRAFNAAGLIRRQWQGETGLYHRLLRIVAGRQGLTQSFATGAQALMSVAVIATGAVLVVRGQFDVGSMIGANILAARALGPIIKLAQMSETFAKARQAVAVLQEFAKAPRERTEGTALAEFRGGIQFQDLAFVHPGQRAPLFESLSLKLEPGATLVVAGANGAGKTTLARLVVGLLEPTRGKILVDGVDLAQVAPEWWRRQVVYLPQEPRFLNATLRDNLLVANPDLDDAALNDLIRRADLRAFLDQSPGGFETPIANGGANFALGVRRRLALARGLATGGRLAVIDDPLEGLDAEGQRAVIDAMTRLGADGATVIVFSHDPQVLAAATEVLDLDTKPVPRLVRQDRRRPKPVDGGPREVPKEIKEAGS